MKIISEKRKWEKRKLKEVKRLGENNKEEDGKVLRSVCLKENGFRKIIFQLFGIWTTDRSTENVFHRLKITRLD